MGHSVAWMQTSVRILSWMDFVMHAMPRRLCCVHACPQLVCTYQQLVDFPDLWDSLMDDAGCGIMYIMIIIGLHHYYYVHIKAFCLVEKVLKIESLAIFFIVLTK